MEHAGYIDGAFVKGAGETLSVEDPSYGAEFASLPGLSTAQFRQAIDSSRRAYDDGRWSCIAVQERAAILRDYEHSSGLKSRLKQPAPGSEWYR